MRTEMRASALSHECEAIIFSIAERGIAPTSRPSSLPPLKRISVGTLNTPNREAESGASSMSTVHTLSLPWYSLAICSIVGAIMRQGPHHAAKKSASTGNGDSITSALKFPSFTLISIPLKRQLLSVQAPRAITKAGTGYAAPDYFFLFTRARAASTYFRIAGSLLRT
jgi:hypothetical protein